MSNNSVLDPKNIEVSGPVNVIRMEGNIRGIKKVIYLFLDYHINVREQTQCTNVFSEDVQKYFANSFFRLNKSPKTYDFFLEIYPSELAEKRKMYPNVDNREKYIEEVVKFFRKLFVYDPKKNKVSINKLFKSIRLHYIDIRDYFKTDIFERVSEAKNIANNFMCNQNISIDGLEIIIELLQVMQDHIDLIVGVLSDDRRKKLTKKRVIRPASSSTDIDALEYLANKIKELYNYDEVRKKMNELLDRNIKNFHETLEDLDNTIEIFQEYITSLQNAGNKLIRDDNTIYLFSYGLSIYTIRNMIVDIINRVETLVDDKFVEYFARFIDIYFLRRFLDKDYITNAITYTGALHSNTYIHVLINMFNFKITHASYSKYNDLNRLNSEIKNKSLMEIQELIMPQTLEQCSDMSHFPRNFE